MKKRIGIIFGGRSGEHEISVRSASNVISNLDLEKYDVIPIAISPAGHWMGPAASIGHLGGAAAAEIDTDFGVPVDADVRLVGDPRTRGLSVLGGETRELELDVVFPCLHGTFGEDGTIQGLLDLSGLPYVGCGVLASSCGMDKAVMKSLFAEAGLPTCRYLWFLRSQWETSREKVIEQVANVLGYPVFVKPANLGSSVGISRADDAESLAGAVDLAAAYDRKIVIEECLRMREIECAILGNDEPEASLPGEYVIKDKAKSFLDYDEKYAGTGNNEFVVPAPVSEELSNKIRQMAISAFKAIDGSGLARVDFFLRSDNGLLLVNEINTIPGLTEASGYPKMWAGSGRAFSEVLDRLIDLAFERHADRKRNLTIRTNE